MFNYSLTHALSNILIDDPSDFQCIGYSEEGYAILTKIIDGLSAFFKFSFSPPTLMEIVRTPIYEDLTSAILSLDKRFFVIYYGNDSVQIIDLTLDDPVCTELMKAKKCKPLFCVKEYMYFLFERDQCLYTTYLRTDTHKLQRYPSKLIKDVLWWEYHPTKGLLGLSTERKISIYQFNEKWNLIYDIPFSSTFPFFIPTHFLILSHNNYIIASIQGFQSIFFSVPSIRLATVKYKVPIDTHNVSITISGSLIVLGIPDQAILVVDSDREKFDVQSFQHSAMTRYDQPVGIVHVSLDYHIYFLAETLAFYQADLNWNSLIALMHSDSIRDWRFVAHFIAGHHKDYMMVPTAYTILSPFSLYHFLAEFLVSAFYRRMSVTDNPPILLKFIPHTLRMQEYRGNTLETIAAIDSLAILPQLQVELSVADEVGTPPGFWKLSRVFKVLQLSLNERLPQNKLNPPFNTAWVPTVCFPNLTTEQRKVIREYNHSKFFSDFVKYQVEVSQCVILPDETDASQKLMVLLCHFTCARDYHLPFPIAFIPEIERLAKQLMPHTHLMSLARMGVFANSIDKNLSTRSPLYPSMHCLPQLPEKTKKKSIEEEDIYEPEDPDDDGLFIPYSSYKRNKLSGNCEYDHLYEIDSLIELYC